MKVRELRFRAAKEGKEMVGDGIRTDYEGGDVDFMGNSGLIAWISSVCEDNGDAFECLTFAEDHNEPTPERTTLETFFGVKVKGVEKSERLPMVLRVNREGEFIATHEAGTNQCGREGARRYRYFVTIEATNDKLTEQGFVIENLWVEAYFRERYEEKREVCRSCEDMAQEAIEHFHTLFNEHPEVKGVNCTRIYVRIHGSDVSFIEAEWKA